MNKTEDVLHSRTVFCVHEGGCLLSGIRQAIKNLKYGLIIAGVLQLLRTLKVVVKNPQEWRKSLRPQYVSIALFLSSTVLLLRLVRCLLRRLRNKDDGWNSFAAGAAAGWMASKTLSKDYWYFYLTFLGSRVIGAAHKFLVQKGVLSDKNVHWHSYCMMTVAHAIHSYGYFLHPFILRDDMYGLYLKMSALTPNEKKWHLTALKYNSRRLTEKFGPDNAFDAITNNRIKNL